MAKLRDTSVTPEKVREAFRKKLAINTFAEFKRKPDREYRWVCTNYEHKQWAEESQELHFMNAGWDIEYNEEQPKDDRTFVPDNGQQEDVLARIKPITKRGRGGKTFILMSCSKERRGQNEKEKLRKEDLRLLAATNPKKVTKKGNEISVQLQDVDLENPLKQDE